MLDRNRRITSNGCITFYANGSLKTFSQNTAFVKSQLQPLISDEHSHENLVVYALNMQQDITLFVIGKQVHCYH